jgi:hypothetical protein
MLAKGKFKNLSKHLALVYRWILHPVLECVESVFLFSTAVIVAVVFGLPLNYFVAGLQ